ncbi:MAG: hypothetical protein ACKO7D_07570 [Bacteroidota bacterium]|jgi:uncharacterized membrane protein
MNFRDWSWEHTKGLLVGLFSPIVFVPLVIVIMAEFQNYPFEYLWKQFLNMDMVRSKFLSLAIIANLLWFYLSLNRERYELGMGIILGTILYLPYVLYVNMIQ